MNINSNNTNFQTISTGVYNFMQNVESALNCNGVCQPGLFYYFKTLASGPPMQNCITGLQNIFLNKPMGIGIVLLISFFLTLLTCIASMSMCCQCCAPKETKDRWATR